MPIDVNDRRIIDGPVDRLARIRPLRYPWARDLWDVMLANTWFKAEADLTDDVGCYRHSLTEPERRMYDKALSFLSNLDGIQLNNLVFNIGKYVTAQEVSQLLVRQAYEEALHVDAYGAMIEAIGADPDEIYNAFESDDVLAAKNAYIMAESDVLKNEYSARNFAMAIVANVILEGIYFYSGFLAFYTLAKNHKMAGSAKMIRFINRDEITHLHLFYSIFDALKAERPELFDERFKKDAMALVAKAVELESAWGKHIIDGGVLGLTDKIIEQYIQYLADERLVRLGFPKLYNAKHPVKWVEKFAQIDGVAANFFEAKVGEYTLGGALRW